MDPNQPVSVYSFDKVIPATAVGRAKGSSIILFSNAFPGNVYRTSTQAKINPNTTLIAAAIAAVPKLVLKACMTFAFVSNTFHVSQGKDNPWENTDPKGIMIQIDNKAIVMPKDKPIPGIIRVDVGLMIRESHDVLGSIDFIKYPTFIKKLFIHCIPSTISMDRS